MPDGAARDRRADKAEKSDTEQALKVLDGEPEVSWASNVMPLLIINSDTEEIYALKCYRVSVLISWYLVGTVHIQRSDPGQPSVLVPCRVQAGGL